MSCSVRHINGVMIVDVAAGGVRWRVERRADGTIIERRFEPAAPATTPCQGCGGAKYRPADFNRPGGADELIRQLE